MKDERVEEIMVELDDMGWDVWNRSGKQHYQARHTTPGRDLLVTILCRPGEDVDAELEIGDAPGRPTRTIAHAIGVAAIMRLLVMETLESNKGEPK